MNNIWINCHRICSAHRNMNANANVVISRHSETKFHNVSSNSNGNMNVNHICTTLNNYDTIFHDSNLVDLHSVCNNSTTNNNIVENNENAVVIKWIDIGCLQNCIVCARSETCSFEYNSSECAIFLWLAPYFFEYNVFVKFVIYLIIEKHLYCSLLSIVCSYRDVSKVINGNIPIQDES